MDLTPRDPFVLRLKEECGKESADLKYEIQGKIKEARSKIEQRRLSSDSKFKKKIVPLTKSLSVLVLRASKSPNS